MRLGSYVIELVRLERVVAVVDLLLRGVVDGHALVTSIISVQGEGAQVQRRRQRRLEWRSQPLAGP